MSFLRWTFIASLVFTMALAGCDATSNVEDEGPYPDLPTRDLTWAKNAGEFRSLSGQKLAFRCSPAGNVGRVWGTDVYTDDSSICTAAVHAGRISVEQGGRIVVEIRPGQDAYQGSARNGITSSPWGNWAGSFVFPE
jgi:hypothetical protein